MAAIELCDIGAALLRLSSLGFPGRAVLELNAADRQLVLLALAHLSVDRPGWHEALHAIALQIDDQRDGRAQLFDQFRELKRAQCERCELCGGAHVADRCHEERTKRRERQGST